MRFQELSDKQCGFISRHLPPPAHTGRPRTRPGAVYADKAYDSSAIRRYLASRKIKSRIPKRIWKGSRKKKTGRRYARVRSAVERFFAWLKCGFRRMSVRCERLDVTYTGFLNLASFLICWRVLG
ncbi:MAG: transposase [Thaumarchaeota archaeon]|nr:transposase [Nitrososphaerota archaeon]